MILKKDADVYNNMILGKGLWVDKHMDTRRFTILVLVATCMWTNMIEDATKLKRVCIENKLIQMKAQKFKIPY